MPLQTYINKNKLPLNSQRKKNSFKSRPDYPHSVHSSHQRSNTIESHIPVDRELFKGLPHLVANFLTKTKVNRRGGLSEREDCVSFRADNHRRRFVKGAEGSLARRPSSSAESRPSFDTLFPFLPRRASKTAKARRRNAIDRGGASRGSVVFEFEITNRENLYACAGCSCAVRCKFHLFKASSAKAARSNPLRRGREDRGFSLAAVPPPAFLRYV